MRSLNLLVLRCRDVEASREFYECLGLTFDRYHHVSGPEHFAHEDEVGVIELYPAGTESETHTTGPPIPVQLCRR